MIAGNLCDKLFPLYSASPPLLSTHLWSQFLSFVGDIRIPNVHTFTQINQKQVTPPATRLIACPHIKPSSTRSSIHLTYQEPSPARAARRTRQRVFYAAARGIGSRYIPRDHMDKWQAGPSPSSPRDGWTGVVGPSRDVGSSGGGR